MEKNYKYIIIGEVGQKPKTKIFEVANRKSGIRIGGIEWYGPWRQYCFIPANDTVFSAGCMMDIIDFISELKRERGEGK